MQPDPPDPTFAERLVLAMRMARIEATYLFRHRRFARIRRPVRFTEFVQWRKLFEPVAPMAGWIDKQQAKMRAAALLGEDWSVPTLWSGSELPVRPPAPLPLMVKARHGCNQYQPVHTEADWQKARRRSRGWMRAPYGTWLDERAYRDVPRGILVEPLLGGTGLPRDYKIYVFAGRAACIQIHVDRAADHRWVQMRLDGTPLSRVQGGEVPGLPVSLDAMIAAAEQLAADFSFARADFYEIAGKPLFGELSFFPGSGLDPFDPDELDFQLGTLWQKACGDQWNTTGDADRKRVVVGKSVYVGGLRIIK